MWLSTALISKILSKNRIISFASKNVKHMSSSTTSESAFQEQKINVDGVNINYVKAGVGDHPVLLLPGALGSIWTDFKPQVENLNKEKLTIIAWDPPGYGKSRPPDRTFPENFFRRDSTWARNLMKNLGYDKFSLLGWSDGGITSLILAAEYPENVQKMIVLGANAYVTPAEMQLYENIRNIDTWSERMRAPLIEVYGESYFREKWSKWVDAMKFISQNKNGDICKDDLPKITCPTLIVHGEKDALVLQEHPHYLKENIKNSRVKFFQAGAHNLHLRYANEFNELSSKFLLE